MVSALPWTSLNTAVRNRLLSMICANLAPGGALLTIQYSTHRERDFPGYFGRVRRVWSPRNVPPAALYHLRERWAEADVDRS